MKLTKDSRSGVYKARFTTAGGKTRELTTKCTNLEDAKQVVKKSNIREIELAARTGQLTTQVISKITTGDKITNEKALEQWLTWMETLGRSQNTVNNGRITVGSFLSSIGTRAYAQPPSALTEDQISSWVNDPKSQAKAGSRKVMLSIVRSFFHYCSAKGWVIGDPSRLVRVNLGKLSHDQKEPRSKKPFTKAEIKLLLDKTEPGTFWHTAIALGRYTGLRLGDICALEWSSLTKPGHLIVWTGKRDARVELPIEPQELENALAAIPISRTRYCFPVEANIIRDVKRRSLFSTQFKRLCEGLGLEGRTFHELRHTYCTEAFKKGIPTPHIAESVGHKHESQTRAYISKE